MWCISAYKYAIGEAMVTEIFSVCIKPRVSQVSLRNMLSSAAVNSLGDLIAFLYMWPSNCCCSCLS